MSVLVGRAAPDFKATVVMPDNEIRQNFSLYSYLDGDIGVLFFYPLDFTFVCPSEIIAFNNRVTDFASRGVKVIGVSIDSHFTHIAWKKTPITKGGIGNIKFPLVADITKDIAKAYDVLIDNSVALRGTFIIDQDGRVRSQLVNDLPIGRNIDDTLRTIDALIFHKENGEVCPAGWNKGQSAMKPTAEGVADYLTSNADKL